MKEFGLNVVGVSTSATKS